MLYIVHGFCKRCFPLDLICGLYSCPLNIVTTQDLWRDLVFLILLYHSSKSCPLTILVFQVYSLSYLIYSRINHWFISLGQIFLSTLDIVIKHATRHCLWKVLRSRHWDWKLSFLHPKRFYQWYHHMPILQVMKHSFTIYLFLHMSSYSVGHQVLLKFPLNNLSCLYISYAILPPFVTIWTCSVFIPCLDFHNHRVLITSLSHPALFELQT